MEYYNDQLCISARELGNIMSRSCYDKLVCRGQVTVARRACRGQYALVVVDSLPQRYRDKVRELYPEGSAAVLHELFRRSYSVDVDARAYYAAFRFDDGNVLPPDKVNEYTVNASVIRSVQRLMADTKALRRAQQGGRVQWEELAACVTFFKREYGHTLPESTLRFRKRVAEFNREGYACLISGKFRNQNSRKVSYRIERLLLSLDSLP